MWVNNKRIIIAYTYYAVINSELLSLHIEYNYKENQMIHIYYVCKLVVNLLEGTSNIN